VLLTIASCRYGQRGAEPYRQNGLGMKNELLTVKKLASELRISMKSIQRAYRNGEIPAVGFCRMIRFDLDQIRNVVKQAGVHPSLRFVPVSKRSAIADASQRRAQQKRLESQAKQREDWQDYGIRWELELKKDLAQVCGQVLSYLEGPDWLEFIVSVLRSYVDFRATTRDEEEEFRYRAPLLDWWLLLTDGFKKGRLVVEKDAHMLPKVKRWVSQSVAPMLAVIYAADPSGAA
jgi:Replication initiation factor